MRLPVIILLLAAVLPLVLPGSSAHAAETCTSQSKMQPADRDALAAAATALALEIENNDQAGVRAATIPEFQANFTGMADLVTATAPRLKGATPVPDQLYLLDASTLQKTASGANPDAQFYCTLNNSQAEADFTIPQLPPARYAFAMVLMEGASPWHLSMLLQQIAGKWMLAGLYPKPMLAAGHDGLWYWQQARTLSTQKEPWSAWLYLQEAQSLVQPAPFVSSTHLEKLQAELAAAAPPALSSGLSAESPFVLKSPAGDEFRFTSIAVDDSLGKEKLDVAAHLKVGALGDAAAARKRNQDAMAALIAAHPELRKSFHGVWIFADAPNTLPYATEQAMSDIQ